MRKLSILLFILVSLLVSQDVLSQSRRARSNFNDALEAIRINDQRAAIRYARRAIELSDDYLQPHLLLAEIYSHRNDSEKSERYYRRVFELDPMFDPGVSLHLAWYSFSSGKYNEAKKFIDFYFKYADRTKNTLYDPHRLKRFIEFSLESVANPVKFEPISIGPGINTHFDEYWPSLSVDERVLVFTRQVPQDPTRVDGTRAGMREDLYVSYHTENGWSRAIPLPGDVNTPQNEGAQCISADGNTVIITACNRPGGVGSCDLYILFNRDGEWTEPLNMRTVNSPYWDSNPTLSGDGRTLYFASARPGGMGGSDIWAVNIDAVGNATSEPWNLGPPINTEYDEVSPFIHPSDNALYFASNGHVGLGGLDLFVSRRDQRGNWQMPENLGYPINTHNEERSLIVNARGEIAMFASDREPGQGLDIYWFVLPEHLRPTPVNYVKGYVYDINTKERLQANLELIDLSDEKTVAKQQSDKRTGEYLVCLPVDRDYAFNVSLDGYLFYSQNFSLTQLEEPGEPYVKNIPLQPIEKGVSVVLENIFFEFDSYDLLPESYAELNKVISFLNDNPNVKIELGGHTDNVGSRAYNENLSKNRARSVYNYLIEKGEIDQDRLSYKGYYFSKPIADNETEEGRAKNRRTEFLIISVD